MLIQVLILSAAIYDRGGYMHNLKPYISIHGGSTTQKTSTVRGMGPNPVWNESFHFHVNENDELIFTLVKDKFAFDKDLAKTTFPLRTLRDYGGHFEGELPFWSDKINGAIRVRIDNMDYDKGYSGNMYSPYGQYSETYTTTYTQPQGPQYPSPFGYWPHQPSPYAPDVPLSPRGQPFGSGYAPFYTPPMAQTYQQYSPYYSFEVANNSPYPVWVDPQGIRIHF